MASIIHRVGPVLRGQPNDYSAVFSEYRYDIVAAFATLPDEAFNLAARWLVVFDEDAEDLPVESRAAIEALGPLVSRYLQSGRPKT